MQNLRQIFYPANQLTLLRLVLIIPVILSILYGYYLMSFVLALIAGISDGLDGLLARRLGQQTTLGTYLDPIADKLLLNSSLVALGVVQQVPLWLVVLVLGRDVITLATVLAMILTTPLRTFQPSIYGKAYTLAVITTVLLTLLTLVNPAMVLKWLQQAAVYSTATLTVVSGLHYAIATAEKLRNLDGAA